jgi:tRNA 2-thiocytidine biosynthesis protein TtcA
MTTESKIARLAGKAILKYQMIEENDRILVGFSGGKDSYTLIDILLRFQECSPLKFGLFIVIVDSGFGADYSKAERFLRTNNLEYLIQKTSINKTVASKIKDNDTGKCCSLCSRLRRGTLYRIARENGCNKLALGHNLDDAIETFFLNIFYNSRASILRPKYLAEDKKTTIIRPLIAVPEELTKKYAKEKSFPIVKEKCLYKKKDSRRSQVKKLITKLSKDNPHVYPSLTNILGKFE